jgi:hypothetical protein
LIGVSALVITCTRTTLNETVDLASGTHSVKRIAEFDLGRVKLGVTIDIAVTSRQRRQCTRIRLGNLYAMEWRGRRTHATPRWPSLSWAASLAVEMRAGETRRFEVGRPQPAGGV